MSREIKRVPLDFDWPLGKVWSGFLMPESLNEEKCGTCGGSGYSAYARRMQDRWYGKVPFDPAETGSARLTPDTPAVWEFAKRNVERDPNFYASYLGARGELAIRREAFRLCGHWNRQWSRHLHQDDVDALVAAGRLYDFTHEWVKGDGWRPKVPAPVVTAEQVNTWSISGGLGHDAINCWVVVKAACERAGKPDTCDRCGGNGGHERYPGQRAEAEAWKATQPPTGDGWQLWETVSEGSPKSPVFATGDELARWMVANRGALNPGDRSITLAAAKKWVHGSGWAPSGVIDGDGREVSAMEMFSGGGEQS